MLPSTLQAVIVSVGCFSPLPLTSLPSFFISLSAYRFRLRAGVFALIIETEFMAETSQVYISLIDTWYLAPLRSGEGSA